MLVQAERVAAADLHVLFLSDADAAGGLAAHDGFAKFLAEDHGMIQRVDPFRRARTEAAIRSAVA